MEDRTRTRDSLGPLALIVGIVAGIMFLYSRLVHASPDPAPPPVGVDWAFWGQIAVAVAAFASLVLHAVATKTRNAKLAALADELDVLRSLVPNSKPQQGSSFAAVPGRTPQAGRARLGVMVAIGLVAAALVGSALIFGCTPQQMVALEHALWDCTAPARADAVAAVTPAVVSVIKAAGSFDGKQIDLTTIRSAISKANVRSEAGVLLSCAAANAFAILEQQPVTVARILLPGGSPAQIRLDPDAVRTTWATIKREQLGGADFKTIDGTVR